MQRTLLVLNTGSSSVKFVVAQNTTIIVRGMIDHLGDRAGVRLMTGRHTTFRLAKISNVHTALSAIRSILNTLNIVPSVVAHRVAHGGQRYARPTILTTGVLHYLHQLIDLAPLHQPGNLMGVDWAKKTWSRAVEWGVFDTAIYRTLPVKVRTYALPPTLTKRLHIEKYGFHGLSHNWAFQQAARKLKNKPSTISAVTIHLGSGASMTLWRHGRPVDTTMGFTPLEGLVMTTRSGDIDPSIPLYIQTKLHWSARRVEQLLEEHAGIIGLSGLRDMRDVLGASGHHVPGWPRQKFSRETRQRSALALAVFVYHVRRTLAGYIGLSKQRPVIVFTGPVGTNRTVQQLIRKDLPAMRGLKILSVDADEEQAIVDQVVSRRS